jgi:nicotinic acid phosphoribosyltransferase
MESFVLEGYDEKLLKDAVAFIIDHDKYFCPHSYVISQKNGLEIRRYEYSYCENPRGWVKFPFAPSKELLQSFICNWVFSQEAEAFLDEESIQEKDFCESWIPGFRLSYESGSIYVRPIVIGLGK